MAQQSTLAATVRPDQSHYVASIDFQVDAAKDFMFIKRFIKPLNIYDRFVRY
jgi:hypothetical protein